MARKKTIRTGGDVRQHPRYSVAEAAEYLGMPVSTLHRWILRPYGKKPPLIIPADPKNNLLSFYNLVEAHVLVSTRRRGVPMKSLRIAVEYVREQIGGTHPLATYEFASSGKDVFVRKLQGQTINASRYGQPALGAILDRYLHGIKRDKGTKMPIQITPLESKSLNPSPVVINPFVSSGYPVIKGTGIVASTVWQRARGGEPLSELAEDYDLKLSEIETVIDYFAKAA